MVLSFCVGSAGTCRVHPFNLVFFKENPTQSDLVASMRNNNCVEVVDVLADGLCIVAVPAGRTQTR